QALTLSMRLAWGVLAFVVWSGRWAFPGLCLLGLVLAITELSATRIRLRARYHLGLCVTFGSILAIIVGSEVARSAKPELFLGFLAALTGAWIVWAGWTTWYYLWVIWLR